MTQSLPSYLQEAIHSRFQSPLTQTEVFAPSNIALIKYWGKRDATLNLPVNSSLSISLGHLGTQTRLTLLTTQQKDEVWQDGQKWDVETSFALRISRFLDLIRQACREPFYFKIETHNTIPTAAGLASSASGFAALTLALDALLQLHLPQTTLSTLARFGSGSASRSLYHGFVIWHRGEKADGSDSFAEDIGCSWQDLRIGVLTIDHKQKAIDSRSGMERTVNSALLYNSWPEQASRDLKQLQEALRHKDFTKLGAIAEHNALSMHATMIASMPPILYWQPKTVELMHAIWQQRKAGLEVYFTMDAGPNIKLLFHKKDQDKVLTVFPAATAVDPFAKV